MSQDITQLPTTATDGMMQALERLARDTSIPTERITELYRLAERREQAMLRRVYFTDMNALQAELTQVTKDKPNPAFHSRYATEAAIDAAARPVYTKYGFSITFGTAPPTVPGNVMITCTVAHRDGFYETHALEGPVVTEGSQGRRMGATPIQAIGSTVTYLRRALIRMVLNIVTAEDDDDGEAQRLQRPPPPPPQNTPPDWDDVVQQFANAATRITDSDQAQKLMDWNRGIAAITAIQDGEKRRQYLAMRNKVEADWLKPVDNTPPGDTDTGDSRTINDIEGL